MGAQEKVIFFSSRIQASFAAVNSASRDQNYRAANRLATLSEPSDGADR